MELLDDLNYIFETLANKHPIGWTFNARNVDNTVTFNTIRECIEACENLSPKTTLNTYDLELSLGQIGFLLQDIVNRTLRLGIGRSQLTKSDLTPMLAKKYKGQPLQNEVYITEKLDGNRCMAHYENNEWVFTSRSGKLMNVDFDMTGLDTNYIYDGEVMSVSQTKLSEARYKSLIENIPMNEQDTKASQLLFNETSGLINRQGNKSGLVYNIFDVVSSLPYYKRRALLNRIDYGLRAENVRILPVLYLGKDTVVIDRLLNDIIRRGGEGIMLNLSSASYEHKRTDALLKYKQVQTMDMRVIDLTYGTGKYEGQIGALVCYLRTLDGLDIFCSVGTGLSDAQREWWSVDEKAILNHIVEVGYHELTQNQEDIGTNVYSLRFPRLICVRDDKDITSEY